MKGIRIPKRVAKYDIVCESLKGKNERVSKSLGKRRSRKCCTRLAVAGAVSGFQSEFQEMEMGMLVEVSGCVVDKGVGIHRAGFNAAFRKHDLTRDVTHWPE